MSWLLGAGLQLLTLFHKDKLYELCPCWITLPVYEEQCLLLTGIWDIQAFCLWTSAADLKNLYISAQREWELLCQRVAAMQDVFVFETLAL